MERNARAEAILRLPLRSGQSTSHAPLSDQARSADRQMPRAEPSIGSPVASSTSVTALSNGCSGVATPSRHAHSVVARRVHPQKPHAVLPLSADRGRLHVVRQVRVWLDSFNPPLIATNAQRCALAQGRLAAFEQRVHSLPGKMSSVFTESCERPRLGSGSRRMKARHHRRGQTPYFVHPDVCHRQRTVRLVRIATPETLYRGTTRAARSTTTPQRSGVVEKRLG